MLSIAARLLCAAFPVSLIALSPLPVLAASWPLGQEKGSAGLLARRDNSPANSPAMRKAEPLPADSSADSPSGETPEETENSVPLPVLNDAPPDSSDQQPNQQPDQQPDQQPADEPPAEQPSDSLPASGQPPSGQLEEGRLIDFTNMPADQLGTPPLQGRNSEPLANLPDGNYRYISGIAEDRAYSDEELRQRGGSLFILKKEGNQITGDLLPRIGLPGICVAGTANGNTVVGAAYPYDTTDTLQDSARYIGETYEPYGSGALQIRRTQTQGSGLYYADAVLDLSSFSMINAGSSLPPSRCGIGQTGFRDQR